MKITLQILRQSPHASPEDVSSSNPTSHFQRYELDISPAATILDCLNEIKWHQDGSLAFRKNCRNTICGSCAMRINGRSTLACKENVQGEIDRFPESTLAGLPLMTIAPLNNLPVVRDLVVDMAPFWGDLKAIHPYVSAGGSAGGSAGVSAGGSAGGSAAARDATPTPALRETLQTPEQRARLSASGNCILCGACYSECNAKTENPSFVGPHALAKAWRVLADTRDDRTADRLAEYNDPNSGVWACTRCLNCNSACPMEVDPLDQISHIKSALLAANAAGSGATSPAVNPAASNAAKLAAVPDSRSLRHRQVLIDLVKRGGWIDERRFGLRVVGNGFRDLRGMASLVPLGLRMVKTGKFPVTFEASEGAGEVRRLIEAVQAIDPEKRDRAGLAGPGQEVVRGG
jgi:succinate dehydrogenase / fumarate reductase, iron-sulfur subunit